MAFAHLHLHTEYSLLDGANALDPLVREAASKGMPALAMTDHGNLHGAVRFHDACLKQGVQPILGCEFYVAPGHRADRGGGPKQQRYHHLILLAQNLDGWKNLMRLSTASWREGYYYKPRIDKELIKSHASGLVCLSACLSGEVASLITENRLDEARDAAKWYREVFGADRYYLEMQDHGIPAQAEVNTRLMEISKDLGLNLVATNDSHYLRADDAHAHEVLLCIGTGSHLDDPDHFKFDGDQFYLKDEDEMRRRFPGNPGALENTLRVADQCRVELPRPKALMPSFDVPKEEGDERSLLRKMALEGLSQRYSEPRDEHRRRLERELGVIENAGFSGYFLVVADFVRYAREHGVPVGPGRGSAAGSLVSYCLRITDLDPLRYGLLFERFLNPERLQPPDIDIDFADHGRDQVIEYVQRKYGNDRVAQVITFGTLGAKAVIRDTGRAMNYTYGEVDALARLVPFELNISLDGAFESSEALREKLRDPRMKKLWDVAKRLEGLARHASTHAAGVVICPDPLENHVPLALANRSEKEDAGQGPVMMTQWDMGSLEKVGLVKMDFLGLRTLTVIDDSLKRLEQAGKAAPDWAEIPMDDPKTYEMLSRGDSHGVFQLESAGMKDLLRRYKPSHEEDLIALVALYRPGPMQMIDEYLQRKHGARPVSYDLPQLEAILKETWGTILYQEQVMQIAVAVGGFSLAQADLLRRAMSKKNAELLEEQRGVFLQGALKQGIKHGPAEAVFDLMARFAEYGFNKSHAAAYGVLAFRTAWLKRHHPAVFMAALMSSEAGNADRLALHMAECKRFGISVEAPDVNRSSPGFHAEPGKVLFGLAAVRHVGWGAAEAVVQRRGSGYKDFEDFLARVDQRLLNARALESLIKAGAFDRLETGKHRAQLMAELPLALEGAQQAQRDRETGQGSLFDSLDAASTGPAKLDAVQPWSDTVRLGFEKEALGCYLSGHPLARWEGLLRAFRTDSLAGLEGFADGRPLLVAGMLTRVRPLVTRRQEPMYRVEMEDLQGVAEVMIWPKLAQTLSAPPKNEDLLLVRGKVDRNADKVQVSGDACVPLSRAFGWIKSLHLELEQGDDEALKKIQSLAVPGGELPVYVHWRQGDSTVVQRLGAKARVRRAENLYDAARGLWGESFWFEV